MREKEKERELEEKRKKLFDQLRVLIANHKKKQRSERGLDSDSEEDNLQV